MLISFAGITPLSIPVLPSNQNTLQIIQIQPQKVTESLLLKNHASGPRSFKSSKSASSPIEVRKNSAASTSDYLLPNILAWIWIAAQALFALRMIFGYVNLRRLRQGMSIITEDKVLALLGDRYRKSITIGTCNQIKSPITAGFIHPVIMLPEYFLRTASDEELRLAISHEVAHIRRCDILLGLLPSIVKSFFFFLPFAYIIQHECDTTREECCDKEAINDTGAHPAVYAMLLMKSIQQSVEIKPAMGMGLYQHHAKRRIGALKYANKPTRAFVQIICIFAVMLVGLFAAPWRLTARQAFLSRLKNISTYRFQVIDLGELYNDNSHVSINDNGSIVISDAGDIRYINNGVTKSMPFYSDRVAGYANALNNKEVVVGANFNEQMRPNASIWKKGPAHIMATVYGYRYGVSRGINDNGSVVGDLRRMTGDPGIDQTKAVLWSHNYAYFLGTLGGEHSSAYDINNNGDIVGKADLAKPVFSINNTYPTHAFLWRKGKMYDLQTLGGDHSLAVSLNNQGIAAGYSETSDLKMHACAWQDMEPVDLGTLEYNGESQALSVNDNGVIAGWASVRNNSDHHAVIWMNNRIEDLNQSITDKAWTLISAHKVNASGMIVGTGMFNGKQHAYLLKPIGN